MLNTARYLLDERRRQRAAPCGFDVLLQVSLVAGPDDHRMAMRVGKRGSQNKLGSGHGRLDEFVQTSSFPNTIEFRPLDFGVGTTLGDASSNNDSSSRFSGSADPLVVLGRETAIRDLERVEDTKTHQIRQMGKRTRDSEETDDTLVTELLESFNQPGPLKCCGVSPVELQDVDDIGLESPEARFHVPHHRIARPGVADFQVVCMLDGITSALRSEDELAAAGSEKPSDAFFGDTVIGCRIEEVDTGIEDAMEDRFGRLVVDDAHAPGSWTSESHRAVSQLCDFQAGSTEASGW